MECLRRPERGARCAGRIAGRALLQADVQIALLVLKFFEAVILHESQKTFDFGQIYAADEISACCLLRLFCHLEFEEIPRGRCEIDCAGFRDNHVVLDANAPDSIEIDARLYRDDHAFLKNSLFAPANPRHFVDFKT